MEFHFYIPEVLFGTITTLFYIVMIFVSTFLHKAKADKIGVGDPEIIYCIAVSFFWPIALVLFTLVKSLKVVVFVSKMLWKLY